MTIDFDALRNAVKEVHGLNAHWWIDLKTGQRLQDNPLQLPVKLALIHSEISEAVEADRCNKKDDHLPEFDGVVVELADALIRILDTAGAYNMPLAEAMEAKLAYNAQRADHKGENRIKSNGKKY